jgi:hypothetical protein
MIETKNKTSKKMFENSNRKKKNSNLKSYHRACHLTASRVVVVFDCA